MKRRVILTGCLLCCLFFGVPSLAYGANEKLYVSIPNFTVTVNEVKYDSKYSEYPFLIHNDITYMPMTYDFATFMGINIRFDKGVNNVYHKDEMILHIENGERTTEKLGQYQKKNANNVSYEAVIPDYHTYISFEAKEYDNQSLYPVINFRGVTYLPLTWNVMHTLLDWEYSFDEKRGLVIDSTKAVRPKGVNWKLFNRMATSTSEYVLGEHFYLRYSTNIYYGGTFLWATANGVKEYSMQEQLRGKINYFNCMYNNGVLIKAEIPPKIYGNILTIMCGRQDFGYANVLATIDLERGVVLQIEDVT